MRDIVLASQSPRRKALMEQVGITCRVCAADIIEDLAQDCALTEAVERLAYTKANAVFAQEREALVIGADTIVVYQDQVLGKPDDAARAKEMLTLLSGKTHQVITAVAILTKERTECFHRISDVRFYELSEMEIDSYIASGEPLDKAGAYGIQGKGAIFVAKIVGDYYNIVGLPIAELVRRLKAYR
ncbi:MAG: septum formation inhibitor Maf [Erysipelotrichaceae bacterium]|nr:septum formation inhibitor Maf [Erysipelotrichaceae bacterium]